MEYQFIFIKFISWTVSKLSCFIVKSTLQAQMEHCLSLKSVQTNCFGQIYIHEAQMEHCLVQKLTISDICKFKFVNTVPLDRDDKNNKTDTFVKLSRRRWSLPF